MNLRKIAMPFIPLSLGIVCLFGCNSGVKFTEKSVKIYKSATQFDNVNLNFTDSYKGIPYIELNDALNLLNELNTVGDINYKLTAKKDNQYFIFNRENGSSLTFDFSNNVVESPNINKFKAASYCKTSLDSRGFDDSFYDESGKKIENQVKLNTIYNTEQIVETACQPMAMLLENYNIKMYKQGDKYYVPFTTFYNIAGNTAYGILYNGEALFITGTNTTFADEDYKKLFYNLTPQTRSQALIEYNYYELCRDLDYNYGLSSEHGIVTDFNTYFTDNGIKDLLLSDNRYNEYKALAELQYLYFADSHSGFTFVNPYYGALTAEEFTKFNKEIVYDPAYKQHQEQMAVRKYYRENYKNIDSNGKVLEPILINSDGDTMIITFDSFIYNTTNSRGIDYYYDKFYGKSLSESITAKWDYLTNEVPGDTLVLISLANDLISEDLAGDKKIKKVVLDLSGNGGGAADTAIFTLGWFNSANMNLVDPISNYKGSIKYSSDINFDKVIDKNDWLVSPDGPTAFANNGGKVYCLTSETSFSCGNYVPAMLKQSGVAKLVGTKSGGGACIVRVSGTADASGICFSGNKKLCMVRNGSYYSIDEGIEPDYYLDNPKILYEGDQASTEACSNRSKLVTYLKSFDDAKEANIDSSKIASDTKFTNLSISPSGKIIKGGNDFILNAKNTSGASVSLTISLSNADGSTIYASADKVTVDNDAEYSISIKNSDIDWDKISDETVYITYK